MVKNPQQAGMNLKVVLGVPGGSDTHWDIDRKLAHVARSSKVSVFNSFLFFPLIQSYKKKRLTDFQASFMCSYYTICPI